MDYYGHTVMPVIMVQSGSSWNPKFHPCARGKIGLPAIQRRVQRSTVSRQQFNPIAGLLLRGTVQARQTIKFGSMEGSK
jgi:hypothetical protein